jgi:hypothetical protein
MCTTYPNLYDEFNAYPSEMLLFFDSLFKIMYFTVT